MGLDGRVAVVTGAGRLRGIGRGVALALAEAGCDVVVTGTGRDASTFPADERTAGWRDIDSVVDEIAERGRRGSAKVCDVGSEQAVEELLDAVLETFGRVDFVVNNAATSRGADRVPVVDLPVDLWDGIMRVNLRGTFLMSRAFGRQLVAQREGGAIVNISSIAGRKFPPAVGAYAASKAAVQALTACMAQELGPDGVRVNAILPGRIETSRLDSIRDTEAWRVGLERIPLGRSGEPEDVAALTTFLCSADGSWITGQSINVDGGACVTA